MVDWYIKHPETLNKIGRQFRGKWKLRADTKILHDLGQGEALDFETRLNEKLKKQQEIAQGGENERHESI